MLPWYPTNSNLLKRVKCKRESIYCNLGGDLLFGCGPQARPQVVRHLRFPAKCENRYPALANAQLPAYSELIGEMNGVYGLQDYEWVVQK
jgi:hypothetical protein